MSDAPLHAHAAALGVSPTWTDIHGATHVVEPDVLRAVLDALGPAASTTLSTTTGLSATTGPAVLVTGECNEIVTLPGIAGPCQLHLEDGTVTDCRAEHHADGRIAVPPIATHGYHTLHHGAGKTTLAIAPRRCWSVMDATRGRRAWGLSAQLYGLYRADDGGAGDFTALSQLVHNAGAHGAAAVAISPVHAQFSGDPGHFSPYAPSSRVMLNALFGDPGINVAAEPGDLIDWPRVSLRRLAASRTAFHAMLVNEAERAAFHAFRADRGEMLERHARFEALHEANPGAYDWHDWPVALRNPTSPDMERFAALHTDDVAFHAFLQFLADRGLAQAQHTARAAGMSIGLITDLAVGVAPQGSDVWGRPEQMLHGLTIGAPPDLLNPRGQDWGLTSFSPHGLTAAGYGSFLDMLRTALRHAGGVRIDHVMGLARLWVMPRGARPGQGAYLRFPVDDLLRLVRLESWRHRAIVLGEDLGTLPDGFRQRLVDDGLCGLRVLWFERDGERFLPPTTWDRRAAAVTSTHDLPTVAGWWSGQDLLWRERLGHDVSPQDQSDRARDRQALWSAFCASDAAAGPTPPAEAAAQATDAACAHVGATACDLALLPLEDALALVEQPNVPGTIDEHPNWRRLLPAPSDALLDQPAVAKRLAAFAKTRR